MKGSSQPSPSSLLLLHPFHAHLPGFSFTPPPTEDATRVGISNTELKISIVDGKSNPALLFYNILLPTWGISLHYIDVLYPQYLISLNPNYNMKSSS
jgi:hypothetical protein